MEAATLNAEPPDGSKVATGHAMSVSERINGVLIRVPKIATLRKKIHALVPPDLRRSRIGKFAFISVALGACVFCAHQVVVLSTKFLSFEPKTVISVLSKDQPVNFSFHFTDDSFRKGWFVGDYVKYLLEKRNVSIVYNGQAITDANELPPGLIARYVNYYYSDELCVPSPNSTVTDSFYNNDINFDYHGADFQSYLTNVTAILATERKKAASIKIDGYSLDTFPWVRDHEDFMGGYLIDHGYKNDAPMPGCEKTKVPFTVKAEINNFVRITYMLPKLSCIPCEFFVQGVNPVYMSAGTASTKPLSRVQYRPTMADSVQSMKQGYYHLFAAHTDVVKRQGRYCNKDINPENDCESACLSKKISKLEEDKHRKTYYEAFEPRAFWRNRTDSVWPGELYTQNLCSLRNQEKLSKIGIGKKFQEKKKEAEEKCRQHCHDCTACRMACSETRVTLHFPDRPQHLTEKSDGTPKLELVAKVDASSEEVMLTEFKVGYTFQLFASDVGGMVKLSATIIGCVSVAAILYKCVMMRQRVKAKAEVEAAVGEKKLRVKSVKKKVTKAVMGLF